MSAQRSERADAGAWAAGHAAEADSWAWDGGTLRAVAAARWGRRVGLLARGLPRRGADGGSRPVSWRKSACAGEWERVGMGAVPGERCWAVRGEREGRKDERLGC